VIGSPVERLLDLAIMKFLRNWYLGRIEYHYGGERWPN